MKKKKEPAPIPRIDGSFAVLGCDLSLSRPGFALIQFDADSRTAAVIQ